MPQGFGARAVGALLFVFCAVLAGGALAEQIPTPAPTPENTGPDAQVQRQVEQPLNSAPVWREVRSGGPQVTTVRGRETNVLIQSRGETWRALRVPVVFWGGMLLALALLGLAVFYWLRGPLDV